VRILGSFALLILLMCTTSHGSEPENNNADKSNALPILNAEELIGNFKDLDKPFLKSGLLEYSPVAIVDETEISNIRLHGPWEPEDRGYLRPPTNSKNVEVFPQNAAAAVLEWFFPSHVGFVANTVPSQAPNKFFKPAAIARLFNEECSPDFYNDAQTGAMRIANALQPGAFKNVEQWNKRAKDVSKKARPSDLAELLFTAFDETRGDRATELGLPPQIVKKILLTWMWVKHSREGCQAYYENLSDTIVDRTAVNEIVWAGPGSCYTEQDYWNASYFPDNNSRELNMLLKIGHPYYEDEFPPALSFDVSTYNGIRFSICGEKSLLSLLMMFLYDFKQKKFVTSKLRSLQKEGFQIKEGFIEFFETIFTTPAHAKNPELVDQFVSLVSNLNKNNTGKKVNYLFPDKNWNGEGFNDQGVCGIAAGQENMLTVLGLVFGDPEWEKIAQEDKNGLLRLQRLCDFFKFRVLGGDAHWWKCEFLKGPWDSIPYADSGDPTHIMFMIKGPVVIFKLGDEPIFEWHFQDKHFDLIRSDKSKDFPSNDCDYREEMDVHIDLPKQEFATLIYKGNIDSITGKIYALNAAYSYEKLFGTNPFIHLIRKWLKPSGEFFAGWTDDFTNEGLLCSLIIHKTTKEIYELSIPQLNAAYVTYIISHSSDAVGYLKEFLMLDMESCDRKRPSFHFGNYYKLARILSNILPLANDTDMKNLVQAGANEYFLKIHGVTLLHVAAYAGSCHLIPLIEAGISVEEKTKEGITALHFAASAGAKNSEGIRQLLAHGAQVNATHNGGLTALHMAAAEQAPLESLQILVEAGADVDAVDNYGKTCLDLANVKSERFADLDLSNVQGIRFGKNSSGNIKFLEGLVKKK
jgi:hypothetical protein